MSKTPLVDCVIVIFADLRLLAGYMPGDLYDLNSAYGTVDELKECIEEMHRNNIHVSQRLPPVRFLEMVVNSGISSSHFFTFDALVKSMVTVSSRWWRIAFQFSFHVSLFTFLPLNRPLLRCFLCWHDGSSCLQVLGDAVLNHRCAQKQVKDFCYGVNST